jgi:hypothetical protein
MWRVLLTAVAVALTFPAAASACTIAAKPAEERVAAAKRAVWGKVVEREQLEAADENGFGERWRYRFRVIETYKGSIRKRMTLIAGTDEAACEAGLLEVGDRFGLVLSRSRGPWTITLGNFISRRELRSVRRPRRG